MVPSHSNMNEHATFARGALGQAAGSLAWTDTKVDLESQCCIFCLNYQHSSLNSDTVPASEHTNINKKKNFCASQFTDWLFWHQLLNLSSSQFLPYDMGVLILSWSTVKELKKRTTHSTPQKSVWRYLFMYEDILFYSRDTTSWVIPIIFKVAGSFIQ